MTGATRLRKIIKQLQQSKLPSNLTLSWESTDILKIEKRIDVSGPRTEFLFVVRVEQLGGKESWWPIVYVAGDGETIRAEAIVNGRTQVNLHKQNHLVELAETWARTLEAQYTTKTIDNALL